jgi:SecD/SecF fusion protein
MSRRHWNWVIIAGAIVVALINPIYRHSQKLPIVTLGLDLKGGVEVLLQAIPEQGGKPSSEQLSGAMLVVQNRVDPQGTKEISLSQVGMDRILLQVPGEKDPDSVIAVIGETALLEFINTGPDTFEAGTDFNVEGTSKRKDEYAKYETILTGKDLAKAYIQSGQGNRVVIGFEFRPDAGTVFGEFTNNHVGQYLTILLDGKVLTSPVIKSPIWGGKGIIEGRFTLQEADKIVRQLNAGALPVPLSILSSSVVGPTLGQDSINKSFLAGIIGFLVVLAFMLVFYRLPGLVANAALLTYVVLVIGCLSWLNATMTLPGIAGFLLSIGMAIDGNIIIFERLKEELRWGKTLVAAMEAAFTRAWAAILDGNLTTLLAAGVLYFYGTGPIKGFAVTLFIGNVVALFSAVFITRNMMDFVIRAITDTKLYSPPAKEVRLPAQMLREGRYYGYAKRTPMWVTISAVIIVAGIVFMLLNKSGTGSFFNLGIDYTGGDKIILQAKNAFSTEGQALRSVIQKYAEGDSVVQVDLKDPHKATIRMRMKTSGKTEKEISDNRLANLKALKEELGSAYGGYVAEGEGQNPIIIEHEHVGPTVGRELIWKAIWALVWGCALIMIYIFIRFASWPMGAGGVLALVHDILMTLAFTAAFRLEVNASFIAVILTIIGYSINDTVIVFDRVRENLRSLGDSGPFSNLCDLSISQTFVRSVNTVGTVVFMIIALLVVGGANIRDFMLAMLIGIISGCYSSIFIATPLMLVFTGGKMQPSPEAPATVAMRPGDVGLLAGDEESSISRTIRQAVERKEKGAKKQRRR